MQLQELKRQHKQKRRKRIGRGGKRGTYAGKGIKGQKSRAGRNLAPIVREVFKRYPKLRGYRKRGKAQRSVSLTLADLERHYKTQEVVSPQSLVEKKILRRIRGRLPKVKIVATGELKKALQVQGCSVSQGARTAITKAGGNIS